MNELIVTDINTNERIKFLYLGVRHDFNKLSLYLSVFNIHNNYILQYLIDYEIK